jgi:DNA-binding transcriptional LysR family regulator
MGDRLMQLRHFRYLLAVADHGGFAQVAEALPCPNRPWA